jgi:hypothetical protein
MKGQPEISSQIILTPSEAASAASPAVFVACSTITHKKHQYEA